MRKMLFVVVALPCLISAGELGLDSEQFRSGDFDALFARWCRIIQEKPATYEALAALWLCNHFSDRLADYRRLEGVVEAALKKRIENGYIRSAYKKTLRRFYLSRGLLRKADNIGAFEGLITKWRFVNEFGIEDGDGAFFINYKPQDQYLRGDKDLLKTRYPYKTRYGVVRTRRWRRPLLHTPPVEEQVPVAAGLPGGVTYALCQFALERDQTIVIEVRGFFDWFRLWFNAKEVLTADRTLNFEPDVKFVAVKAKAGWNTILIKTTDTRLCVYLRDRNGKPLSPRFEKGDTFHPVTGGEVSKEKVALPFSAWLRGKGAAKAAGEWRYLLVLYAAESGVMPDVAEELAHEMGEEKSPFSRYFAALGFEAADHCPEAWAANRMRRNLEAALDTAPDFLPAAVKYAQLLAANDKPEQAVKVLKKALLKAGQKQWALLELAKICEAQDWERERIEAAKTAERLNPTSPAILLFWSRYYSTKGNHEKFVEFQRRYLELYARDQLEAFLAEQASRDGNHKMLLEYYLKMWKRYPENLFYLYNAAEVYLKMSRYREALRLLQHAMSEFSEWVEPDSILRQMLSIYRMMGDKEKAAETAELLFLVGAGPYGRPFDMERYAAFLRGQDDDFFKPYRMKEEKVKALMAEKITAKDYPRSPVLLLLHDAVVRLLPDGSASEYHNLILKVLTEEGRMYASRMGAPLPDTIRIESVTPDGASYDPTPTQWGLVMQNVKVGGFVRLEGRLDGTNWSERMLQLQGRGACAHLRRLTLIITKPKLTPEAEKLLRQKGITIPEPKDSIELLLHNIRKEPNVSVSVSRSGETVVVTIEARRMEAAERVYFMPEPREIFPVVENRKRRRWVQGAGRLFSGLRQGGRRITWLVGQTARTIAGGAKSVYEKVERLYRYCQTQIRDGYNLRAHATLLEMAGDRQAVFEACLRALGIETAAVTVFRVGTAAPPEWESSSLADLSSTNYLLVETEKGPLFLDLRSRYCRLGRLAPGDQGMPAVIARQDGSIRLITMPREPLPERQSITVKVTADLPSKEVKFDPGGGSLKDYLLKMPEVRRLQIFEGYLSQHFRGIKIDKSKFQLKNLRSLKEPALIHLEGRYEGLLSEKEKGLLEVRLCLPSVQIGARLGGKPERKYPAYRASGGYDDYDYQEVTIHLGKHQIMGKLPEAKIVTDFGAFVLKCTHDKKSNTVKVVRYFVILPFRLPPKRFPEVLDFCRKVQEAEGLYLLVK